MENLSVGMKLHAKYSDGEFYAGEVAALSKSSKRSKAPVGICFKGFEDDPLTWCKLADLKSKSLPKVAQKDTGKATAKAKVKAKAKAKATEKTYDYSALEKGQRLQARSEDGKWYAAQIVTVSKGKAKAKAVKINWVGYTSASDEWLGGDDLRSKNITTANSARKDTHVTIVPYFDVPAGKMDEFKKGFADFYTGTKRGTSECFYYGFCCQGNMVHCREGYKSAEGVLAHLKDVETPLGKAAAIAPPKLSVMGPAAELEKLKEPLAPFNTEFWELDEGSLWFGGRGGKDGADTHVTIVPYFTVPDGKMDEFKKGFPDFYKGTKNGTKKCLYYGFASCGNKVFCREGYSDAEGVLQHLKDVGGPLGKATEIASVELAVMGPAAELEKLKEPMAAFNTVHWESAEGSMWFGVRRPDREPRQDTHVTICPYFTVPDGKMDDFKKGFGAFYKGTRKGTKGCLYYGFAINGDGVYCREGYKDAASAMEHIKDVKECLDKALEIASVKLSVMGPKAELEKCKDTFAPLGAEFWETDEGGMWFGKKGGAPGKSDTHLTICPYFDVPAGKMDEFKAGFKSFYAGTKAGTKGCLYYGFAICGNKVFCREGYKSAKDVLTHLGDVKAELDAAVAIAGPPKLAVMGPEKQLEPLKEPLAAFNTEFWALDRGSFWK